MTDPVRCIFVKEPVRVVGTLTSRVESGYGIQGLWSYRYAQPVTSTSTGMRGLSYHLFCRSKTAAN